MLQQTQVTTVIPYYQRFMKRFKGIESLANSSLDEVLRHWAGLGYYARGRNLHKAAQIIMKEHKGVFPETIEKVNNLPGIGRSTAGAILALSKNQRHTILDGNVKRILCRYHGIVGFPGTKKVELELWQAAEEQTPLDRVADYTQAIMDIGATLCTRSKPGCVNCPQQTHCYALKNNMVAHLPQPRPKRNRPDKHLYMLALLDSKHNIALFKRPAEGIWGGLYSLPEFDTRQSCSEQLAKYKIDTSGNLRTGENIQHAFSHFNLCITPLIISLPTETLNRMLQYSVQTMDQRNMGVTMAENTMVNISSNTSQFDVGVPAPIRKILDGLSNSPS